MTSEESFYMVGTHSTVEKRAKRMPDTTVETTQAKVKTHRIGVFRSAQNFPH